MSPIGDGILLPSLGYLGRNTCEKTRKDFTCLPSRSRFMLLGF